MPILTVDGHTCVKLPICLVFVEVKIEFSASVILILTFETLGFYEI